MGRRKYSEEERLKVVLNVIERHMSTSAAGAHLGIPFSVVQRWVRLYESHGLNGLFKVKGTYDGDFKIHVVEYMHENHLSIREAAAKFGVPQDHTVGKWERIYYEGGPQALYEERRGKRSVGRKPKKPQMDKQTEEDLIAEVQRLRIENAYLKKLNALVQKRIGQENGKKQPPSTN